MTRFLRHPVACVAALLIVTASNARAQPTRSPFRLRPPAISGTDLFLAPHGRTTFGRLHIGGQLELARGRATAWSGAGSIGFEPFDGLQFTANVLRGSVSANATTGADRMITIALDGQRAGISAAHYTAESSLEFHKSELRGTELRAWKDVGRLFELGVSMRSARLAEHGEATDEHKYIVAGYEFVSKSRTNYAYITERRDIEAEITASIGMFRVTAVAGRAMADHSLASRTWAYGRIAMPLAHGLELLFAAGRNDGGTGITREPGRFARLGMRIDVGRTRVVEAPLDPMQPASSAAAMAVLDSSDDTPRLLITSPAADRVEVKGDFTAWQARAMTRLPDGRWTYPLRAGVLRFNIRVDSDSWTVPAGVPVVADEFSGAPVAVIVVR